MTLTISRHVKAQKSLQHRMKYGVLCRCIRPEPYPSSAYCLGCDTNADRVIMSIWFEHYTSCGENPCPHRRPSNFPLVTQRKGAHATILHDAKTLMLCFAHVAKMQGALTSEFLSRDTKNSIAKLSLTTAKFE